MRQRHVQPDMRRSVIVLTWPLDSVPRVVREGPCAVAVLVLLIAEDRGVAGKRSSRSRVVQDRRIPGRGRCVNTTIAALSHLYFVPLPACHSSDRYQPLRLVLSQSGCLVARNATVSLTFDHQAEDEQLVITDMTSSKFVRSCMAGNCVASCKFLWSLCYEASSSACA